jgi:hypothetical protein
MTQTRMTEIRQMLEACEDVDATDWDAEKTSIVAELLAAFINKLACSASNALSTD